MRSLAIFAACTLALSAAPAPAATITIIPGTGFADATPVAPEGGNNGTTLGQQRLNVFNAAAAVWAATLQSNRTIKVSAQFVDLSCGPSSGTLGSAGATNNVVLSDGTNDRFFAIALAEALTDMELNGANNEIASNFNARIDANDTGCLGNTRWYYGLTGPEPAGTIALFPTILHELGHGLGFASLLCTTSGGCTNTMPTTPQGGYFFDVPDVWADFLRDNNIDGAGTNRVWVDMTNAERVISFTHDPLLVWDGPMVTARFASFGQSGAVINEGRMRMFAPASFQGGSSISHFHEDASPNLLMEPIADDDVFNQTDLTVALLEDIGWGINSGGANQPPVVTGPATINVTEDVAAALTGFTFSDPDAAAASVVVTFAVGSGAINSPSCVGVTSGGSATSRTLTGSIASISVCVTSSSVTFTTANNGTSNVVLTTTINDNGNTGSGGAMTDSMTTTLSVTAVNDAPVITAPATITVNEDVLTNLTGISFADVDAASGNVIATFAVGSGTMNSPACASVTVGGSATSRTLTGTLANVNACLSGNNVRFTSAANTTADVTLGLTINDNGNTGGAAMNDTQNVTLDVVAVNDAPVLTVPLTRAINATGSSVVAGISVADVDSASGLLDLRLSVADGTLTAAPSGGVTVTGTGTAVLTLTGTVANLNAYVAANNVMFVQDGSPSTTVMLTSLLDDNGNTGSGGTLSDTETTTLDANALFSNGFE